MKKAHLQILIQVIFLVKIPKKKKYCVQHNEKAMERHIILNSLLAVFLFFPFNKSTWVLLFFLCDIKKNFLFKKWFFFHIFHIQEQWKEELKSSSSSRSRASYAVIKNHDGVTFYITMKHCALNIVAIFALTALYILTLTVFNGLFVLPLLSNQQHILCWLK